MVINTNIAATNAGRLLGQSTGLLSKSLARLSSGSRIVSPEDDAAGLAQSIKLNNETLRNSAALTNIQNAISLVQTKDGYAQKVQKVLDRMSEISVLALDRTKTDTDRANYDAEFQKLKAFIDDVSTKTFNGVRMFQSTYEVVAGALTWDQAKADAESKGGHLAAITNQQEWDTLVADTGITGTNYWIGATDTATEGTFKWVTGESFAFEDWRAGEPNNSGDEDYVHITNDVVPVWNDFDASQTSGYILEKGMSVTIDGDATTMRLGTLGMPSVQTSVTSITNAEGALSEIKGFIQDVARLRAEMGANLRRLEYHAEELQIVNENTQAAVSRISDVDVAEEATQFSRLQILTQSGSAMLAQANLMPAAALKLLG